MRNAQKLAPAPAATTWLGRVSRSQRYASFWLWSILYSFGFWRGFHSDLCDRFFLHLFRLSFVYNRLVRPRRFSFGSLNFIGH